MKIQAKRQRNIKKKNSFCKLKKICCDMNRRRRNVEKKYGDWGGPREKEGTLKKEKRK